ncbi:MAG: lanthionine synthetase C family protein [Deltaproteobacteria bacterium]|nr:lanthionine synthetase C family protein [Deltaproteobacteria bacterium]
MTDFAGPPSSDPPSRAAWSPFARAEDRAAAWATVEEIGGELSRAADSGELENADLAVGSSGVALFLRELALETRDSEHLERSDRLLSQAIDQVAARPYGASFFGGFPGVSWALGYTEGFESGDELSGVELAIAKALRRKDWQLYDVVAGVVGLSVLAMARWPGRFSEEALELVVDRLEEISERAPESGLWFVTPELLVADAREQYPRGAVNLGLAHGIPCAIAALAGIVERGCAADRAGALLSRSIEALLSHRMQDGRFPAWAAPNMTPTPSRIAWCYGEPGIAISLLHAARVVGRADWLAEGRNVALQASSVSFDESGVKDAGICHGAAGLSLIFARLHSALGEPRLLDSARFWYGRTLQMSVAGRGIAGYAARGWKNGAETWSRDPGILTGVAGIGLVLLAGLTDRAPDWDQLLLVSLPELG